MLKIKSVEFFKSFSDNKKLPNHDYPELAFVGRSNVGKSSLINDLCQKKIAMTSSTPGKTRLINFFTINSKLYFVDLPGYGFAKASKSMRREWPKLIENYLIERKQLRCIFFLLDIRRTPNEHDLLLNEWFSQFEDVKILYILTKTDKLTRSNQLKQKKLISEALQKPLEDFILYSVTKKMGKVEVLKKVEEILTAE